MVKITWLIKYLLLLLMIFLLELIFYFKKIKITSPDKFRVKPGTGIINPASTAQITISFLKGKNLSNNQLFNVLSFCFSKKN
jgi:biopolymer transport protein ExbD